MDMLNRSVGHISSTTRKITPSSIRADLPIAAVGENIPYIIGRRRIGQPNVLDYGNLRAEYTTVTNTSTREYIRPYHREQNNNRLITEETVYETITTVTRTPTGFLTDITIGICLGPDVVLKGVYADNKPIWLGTAGPARTVFNIGDNDSAFRNVEVAFNGGAYDQPVDPWTVPSVFEPPLPTQLTVDVSDIHGNFGMSKLWGYVSEYASNVIPTFSVLDPLTFGNVSGSANLWELAHIMDLPADNPGSAVKSYSTLSVMGNSPHPSLDIKIGNEPPITVTRSVYHAGITIYRYEPISSRFGLQSLVGQTLALSITPYGPGKPNNIPGYVGIAYVIIKGMRADIGLGSLSFEVERFPNPLGLTNARNRLDDDINVATALYDTITNPWGGAGLSADNVDITSFRDAAAIYAAEANYCSIVVNSDTNAKSVIDTLQDQTYSVVYHNPQSGRLENKPIRVKQVSYNQTVKFGRTNIIDVRNFNKSSWADTFETIRGVYVERTNSYEPTPVMVQNVGNVSDTGRTKRSMQANYPYVTKKDLTLDLVSRELASASVPTYTFGLLTNRDGASCLPGDVVLVNYHDYELYGVPMVVNKVRKNTKKENTVSLTLSQYILPDQSPLFAPPDDAYDPVMGYGPVSPADARIITAPYWIAERAGLINVNTVNNGVYAMVLPVPANDLQMDFRAYIHNAPNAARANVKDRGLYPSYGTLATPIDRYDGYETGVMPSIVITGVINDVYIDNQSEDTQRAGRALVYINDEIFTYSSFVKLNEETWQLNDVKRALIDTTPVSHAIGSHVFITSNIDGNIVGTLFNYPVPYTPSWRLTSATINQQGKYNDAYSTTNWARNIPRTTHPPRPHNTMIDGVRSSTPAILAVGGETVISWRTRARSTDTIKYQTDPAELSEGTNVDDEVIFHRVYIRDGNNTQRLLGATANDGNYNDIAVTIPNVVVPGNGTLYVRAVNQFGESVYDDALPITIMPGDILIDETGNSFFIDETTDNYVAQE